MFDMQKFGRNLSRLRKAADMTQSELADRLNLTRQAISRYELGDSFPDVSILVLIADIFHITLDELINAGEPTRGESQILQHIARGEDVGQVFAESISDIVNLAPLLKPSVLTKLSSNLSKHGIDISNIVALAEYLNDESVVALLENASFDAVNEDFLEKLLPLLDERSKNTIFQKILDGEMDWHLIKALVPYAEYICSPVEAAVVDGALPPEALKLICEARHETWVKRNQREND